jgi:hypothetical protein
MNQKTNIKKSIFLKTFSRHKNKQFFSMLHFIIGKVPYKINLYLIIENELFLK